MAKVTINALMAALAAQGIDAASASKVLEAVGSSSGSRARGGSVKAFGAACAALKIASEDAIILAYASSLGADASSVRYTMDGARSGRVTMPELNDAISVVLGALDRATLEPFESALARIRLIAEAPADAPADAPVDAPADAPKRGRKR